MSGFGHGFDECEYTSLVEDQVFQVNFYVSSCFAIINIDIADDIADGNVAMS